MPTLRLKTNLRCQACVEAIRPAMDQLVGPSHWQADVSDPAKILRIDDSPVTLTEVEQLLQAKGYQVLGQLPTMKPLPLSSEPPPITPTPSPTATTYYPLLLLVAYIIGVTAAVEMVAGQFDWMRAMNHFMAGFFLTFSFFKLLNLNAFADAYMGYDVIAARSRGYALAYPFIELSLGFAYLTNVQPLLTNAITFVVLGISTIGVVQSLLAKRTIRCACLGSVFNLPMSSVTLIEDLTMVVMSAIMLLTLGFSQPH